MTKARSKGKTNKKQTWLGLLAVIFCAAVLLALLAGTPKHPSVPATTPPETTAAAPTVPPNPYAPEDFQLDGDYLTYLPGGSRLGIDVSFYQGEIDWQQVAEAGVEFAMIRLGHRGYETGDLNTDDRFSANLSGARAAGLDVGVYFFSQAVSEGEAREEAEYVLSLLQGTALEMPVVFDWEYVSSEARTGTVGRDTLTKCTKAFCQTVEAAGYTPMVYFNWHQGQEMLDLTELTDYEFWLAMYDTAMDFPYKVRMWQYTESGHVPGIEGKVDLNLWLP